MEKQKEQQEATPQTAPMQRPMPQGRKQKKPTKAYRSTTSNGRHIEELMALTKKKGNPKDFVIIVGKRLMDYWASYDLLDKDGKSVGVKDGIALIHKKELHKVLGDDFAAKFWNRKTGTRVPGRTDEQLRKEHGQTRQG